MGIQRRRSSGQEGFPLVGSHREIVSWSKKNEKDMTAWKEKRTVEEWISGVVVTQPHSRSIDDSDDRCAVIYRVELESEIGERKRASVYVPPAWTKPR
jgi:hypothetical protein